MPLLIYIFLQNNFRLNFWLILTFTWTLILRLILHDLYIFLVNEPNFKRFLELRPLDRRQDFALNLLGARGNRAHTPSPLFFAKFIWYDLKVFSKETILSTFLWQNINWYKWFQIAYFYLKNIQCTWDMSAHIPPPSEGSPPRLRKIVLPLFNNSEYHLLDAIYITIFFVGYKEIQ